MSRIVFKAVIKIFSMSRNAKACRPFSAHVYMGCHVVSIPSISIGLVNCSRLLINSICEIDVLLYYAICNMTFDESNGYLHAYEDFILSGVCN